MHQQRLPDLSRFSYCAARDKGPSDAEPGEVGAALSLQASARHRSTWLGEVVAAKVRRRLPIVLTVHETSSLLSELHGVPWLVCSLLCVTGLGLLEGLQLRIKDTEVERREVLVRDGKSGKDRITVLPESLIAPLRDHLERVRALHVD